MADGMTSSMTKLVNATLPVLAVSKYWVTVCPTVGALVSLFLVNVRAAAPAMMECVRLEVNGVIATSPDTFVTVPVILAELTTFVPVVNMPLG